MLFNENEQNKAKRKKYVSDAFRANKSYRTHMAKILRLYNIKDHELYNTSESLKKRIDEKNAELMKAELETLCRTKKHNKILKHYRDNSKKNNDENLVFKAGYVEKFTRFGVKNIVEGRCLLFPCRANYQHVNRGKAHCRWCKDTTKLETETYVSSECKASPIYQKGQTLDFFSNDLNILNGIVKTIKKYYSALRERGERY